MKRILLMALVVLFTTGTMTAQAPKGKKSEAARTEQKRPDGKAHAMEQAKAYVTEFGLNEQQAKQFTETYHAYNKKLHAIHLLYRPERPAEGETLTDEQIEQRILDNFAQSRAILDVREQYYKEFRKILTPSQINKIFEDEKARRAEMRGRPRPERPAQ
jgi:pyruvate/2-oxoglutarate dehydrogenase complex dihydrolipoamide acyltransferase (E2) component